MYISYFLNNFKSAGEQFALEIQRKYFAKFRWCDSTFINIVI